MLRTPRQVVELWVAAFNACDAEAASVYAIHAVNTQFAAGPPVVGREQIRAELRGFFLAFPDIKKTLVVCIPMGSGRSLSGLVPGPGRASS